MRVLDKVKGWFGLEQESTTPVEVCHACGVSVTSEYICKSCNKKQCLLIETVYAEQRKQLSEEEQRKELFDDLMIYPNFNMDGEPVTLKWIPLAALLLDQGLTAEEVRRLINTKLLRCPEKLGNYLKENE